jgi:hypothetical protein
MPHTGHGMIYNDEIRILQDRDQQDPNNYGVFIHEKGQSQMFKEKSGDFKSRTGIHSTLRK